MNETTVMRMTTSRRCCCLGQRLALTDEFLATMTLLRVGQQVRHFASRGSARAIKERFPGAVANELFTNIPETDLYQRVNNLCFHGKF